MTEAFAEMIQKLLSFADNADKRFYERHQSKSGPREVSRFSGCDAGRNLPK